jgi:hypothetical protein
VRKISCDVVRHDCDTFTIIHNDVVMTEAQTDEDIVREINKYRKLDPEEVEGKE